MPCAVCVSTAAFSVAILPMQRFLALTLLVVSGSAMPAQQLPSAPVPQIAQQGRGTISGVITDIDGDFIPGATVSLDALHVMSDVEGKFLLANVPAGNFTLLITSKNSLAASFSGSLAGGQLLQEPPIVLLAAANMDVEVTASAHDLAEAELKGEVQQRIFAVLPNFYVTYDWHAAPLSTRQKFRLAARNVIDPANFVVEAIAAGIEQANNTFSGFGPGPAGYWKRYAAGYGDLISGTYFAGAILPSLFHQDPRYFYMGHGTVKRRAGYALAAAVIARGDNGKWQPNYSSVLGGLAAAGLSNAYYPAENRNGASLTFVNLGIGVASDAISNLVQEFAFHRLTTHKPPTEKSSTSPVGPLK